MPVDAVRVWMRQFRAQCDVLRLSGGEPTLHPDIRDILWEARYLGYKVVLLTNGQRTLGLSMRDYVDEFVVSVVGPGSLLSALWYQKDGRIVSLHVVSVLGNEKRIVDAIVFASKHQIPIHVLALQRQGRGENCEPLELITWTGMRGCTENNKITVTASGKVVTCSALKYGGKCSLK